MRHYLHRTEYEKHLSFISVCTKREETLQHDSTNVLLIETI